MKPRVFKTDSLASPPGAKGLHEIGCAFVEESFSLRGSVQFMWLLALGRDVLWLETNWESPREKVFTTNAMKSLMQDLEVDAYSFVSEAWALASHSLPPELRESITDFAEKNGLAGIPDCFRDDVAMITSFDRDGEAIMTQYKVTVRKQPGRGLNFLGPRMDDIMKGGPVKGRLWNLLVEKQ